MTCDFWANRPFYSEAQQIFRISYVNNQSSIHTLRDTNYLGTSNKVIRLPAILPGRSTLAKSCNDSEICSSIV